MALSFPAERQSIIDAAQLLVRTGVLSHRQKMRGMGPRWGCW
jgi:hypothetical protein